MLTLIFALLVLALVVAVITNRLDPVTALLTVVVVLAVVLVMRRV